MEANTLIGDFSNTRRVLEEYGQAVIEAYRAEMKAQGKNASGNLSRKLHVEVKVEGGGGLFGPAFAVDLTLPAYWYNVEYGRPPCPPSKHWVPMDALLKWIQVKPVIPYPDASGRIPSPESLAFMINRAINDPDRRGENPKRPGIAPTPILQDAVDAVNARYDGLIKAALLEDMDAFIQGVLFSDFSTKDAAGGNIMRGKHKGR